MPLTPMHLINKDDINDWAKSFDSKGYLPVLLSRLIRATTPISTKSSFPSGSGVFVGGWDGIVNCSEERNYVPKGISLWELGTEGSVKGKADSDYTTRTANPLGYQPKDSTFIFVTPRYWKLKNKWLAARRAEGLWKDIKVYDAEDLEQWLDTAIAVSRAFSVYLNKYPFDGVITTDEFWEEWSKGPRCNLVPEVITAGRDFEKDALFTFLNSTASIKGIKASTKDEAIAFIIACAKQFETNANEYFFSKSLIVDTEANYRAVRINNTSPLNLIPRFDNYQPLYAAVSRGHHVIVPLGADDSFNQDTITLPTIDRDGQITGLMKSGLPKEDSENFSREAGRNITILKKLLKFPDGRAAWTKTENVREIVPALLLGRWNEQKPGDRNLLEILSEEPYQTYLQKLNHWRNLPESPIIKIGETWRLVSPLDLWTTLSSQLNSSDFEKLKKCIMVALKNGNPAIQNDGSIVANYITPQTTFSEWSREGLIQSLILIGHYGKNLQMPTTGTPQGWVDDLIKSLFDQANSDFWISLNHEMPLIAEASPDQFLSAIDQSLALPHKPVMQMFVEEESMFGSTGNYTGLLWALEGLAWLPEYLPRAGLILAHLAATEPGGKLLNRPINSLIEIFKSWHFQTLASYDERTSTLATIAGKEPKIAWSLFRSLLPQPHGFAHPTHKLRWRLFEKNTNINYTWDDVNQLHSFLIENLLAIFDFNEESASQLVDDSVNLSPSDRRSVINFLLSSKTKIGNNQNLTWHATRKVLSNHRTHRDMNWALPETELALYQSLYDAFQPLDINGKYLWLFNDHWPEFPEGGQFEEQEEIIHRKRIEAIEIISKNYSVDELIALSRIVKEPMIFGDIIGNVVREESQILSLLYLLNEQDSLNFIHSFLFRKSFILGFDWIRDTFSKVVKLGFSSAAIGQFFVPLNQSSELWSLVERAGSEVKKEYWSFVYPRILHMTVEEKITALENLMEYNRFVTAVTNAVHFPNELPSELIFKVLEGLVVYPTEERARFQGYEIERLFEELDKREDVPKKKLISLEWQFLSILASYGRRRSPKLLHQELANDPQFFIEVLRLVYRPKSADIAAEEKKDVDPEQIQAMAHQAYRLLQSWKTIPGFTEQGNLDKDFLNNWVDTVRDLATKADRLEVADAQIGQILARYPEKETPWPPDTICEVIERINTDRIKNNFSSEAFNKRGSSMRGPFDGGNIERDHAEYFQKQAQAHKSKFPIVSKILSDLATGYLAQAKRMDEEAERERLEY